MLAAVWVGQMAKGEDGHSRQAEDRNGVGTLFPRKTRLPKWSALGGVVHPIPCLLMAMRVQPSLHGSGPARMCHGRLASRVERRVMSAGGVEYQTRASQSRCTASCVHRTCIPGTVTHKLLGDRFLARPLLADDVSGRADCWRFMKVGLRLWCSMRRDWSDARTNVPIACGPFLSGIQP